MSVMAFFNIGRKGESSMSLNEQAVSPVIGVMLMHSVTVIIAAIVSAAAGGLSGADTRAPSAILDIHFYANRSYGSCSAPTMTIEHISGSPLQTKDLTLATYFRNGSGHLVKGALTGERSVAGTSGWSTFGPDTYSGVLFINDADRFGSPLRSSGTGYKSWFGNASAVLMAGDILVTPIQFCESAPKKNMALNTILNADTSDPDTGYRPGAVITTKIVHIPNGQILFDKEVVVA